jgi:ATP-binding cassette subfamily F protein uup
VVDLGDRTVNLRAYLEQFLFDGSKQRQKVGSLSGGERARVALAKALKSGANLLLLDEPTNDLDVMTLAALEEMLTAWPGCAIVVSHDRAFLNHVATSILAIAPGSATLYPGNYDTYLSLRPADAATPSGASTRAPAPGAPPAPPPPAPAGPKKLTYAERIELDGILDRIGAAESRVSDLETALADPSLYATRAHEAKGLQEQLVQARQDVERLTARWEELESRRA